MVPHESSGENTRESGVDLGSLDDALQAHSYPSSTDELLESFGDYEIDLPDGSETFSQVIGPMGDDTFDDPESVRQAIFNMVGAQAVGRKGYSDRGGASPVNDVNEHSDESF